MQDASPEEKDLARLNRAYQEAIDDVLALDVSEVVRVARLLEVEARFLGQIEACREAVARQRRAAARPN